MRIPSRVLLPRRLLAAALPLALAAPVALAPPAQAADLPAGFASSVVANVAAPTAMAFLPDGRALVTTQPGRLRVLRAGGGLVTAPALDLGPRACTNTERGLLGVAVDPSFRSNGHVYLFWTRKVAADCPVRDSPGVPVNRVSRFTMSGDRVVAGSEEVLADGIRSYGQHNGGDLHVGADGNLYVSVGDGICQVDDPTRCGGDNANARRLDIPQGKLLRLTRTGGVPSTNPYVGRPGARRCLAPTGPQPGTGPCVETFASGLRNPFRFAIRPGTSEPWVNDVGQDSYEEVNRVVRGGDYGWNACEGDHARGTSGPCTLPGAKAPLLEYGHGGGCSSITGGAFVPGQAFGSDRAGSYLYADYVCGTIFERTAGGAVRPFLTGLGRSSAVALAFGPSPQGQALYFLSYAGGGAVHRVVRSGGGNTAPVARVRVASTDPGTRTVRLDGSGSYDPDGGDAVVQYRWAFGDGATATTATPAVQHRYATGGRRTATLRVVDRGGAVSAPATVAVTPGNAPPVLEVRGADPGARYAVGDTPTLSAWVTDAEDGGIPARTVRWTVLLRHDEHTHPRQTATAASISPVYPSPESLDAATKSLLEVTAAVTDSAGATTTTTVLLRPRTVPMTFATDPAGRAVTVNGERLVGPTTVTSWAGWPLNLTAPDQAAGAGTARCTGWSDGGACSHRVVTPATARTLTARFDR